jgi:hypothetical protein
MIHPNAQRSRGQAATLAVVLFTAATTALIGGILSPLSRSLQISNDLLVSKQSYYAADSGAEDAYYRIHGGLATSYPATLVVGNATATISVTNISGSEQQVRADGTKDNLVRTVIKNLTSSDAFSFDYGLQAGIGGITFMNNSYAIGDIYSNGPITSSNANPNSYNMIYGSVVSAGPSGTVSYIHSTSTVYSRSMHHITIDRDAHYQNFNAATNTVTISGTSYPSSPDQPTTTLPISDATIANWETNAASGGTATCSGGTYTISSGTVTMGPKKIPCDLSITGNGTTLKLTGTLWVTGFITIDGSGGSGVQIKVDDSVGDKTVAIIADKSSASTTSSYVTVDNNANFYGSTGNAHSYVMLVSMNSSAERGGAVTAMDIKNGSVGNLLTYAPHGLITLENNVYMRAVTAYKLKLKNNAVVNFGLGNLQDLLTTGQGGTWKISRWRESL